METAVMETAVMETAVDTVVVTILLMGIILKAVITRNTIIRVTQRTLHLTDITTPQPLIQLMITTGITMRTRLQKLLYQSTPINSAGIPICKSLLFTIISPSDSCFTMQETE
jgi:hypothetical protein